MSNQVFRQNLNDKKGPQPGGPYLIQMPVSYTHLDLPELAAEIAPDWDLPAEAVQSGLETLRSHLELVRGAAALLYEML